jgi:hypothetical protein
MSKLYTASLIILGLLVGVGAQEIHTLTTPVVIPSTTTIRVQTLYIDIITKTITITWLNNKGEVGSATYDTGTVPTGTQIITALNTANLTSNSLIRRVLTRLATDGHIPAGTVTGTPE